MAKHKCEEPGCGTLENIVECLHPMGDDVVEYYCVEHCKKHGYCYGCGSFCAGSESFDFSSVPGMCYECLVEFKHELGEDDDFEEDDDDYYDPMYDY